MNDRLLELARECVNSGKPCLVYCEKTREITLIISNDMLSPEGRAILGVEEVNKDD